MTDNMKRYVVLRKMATELYKVFPSTVEADNFNITSITIKVELNDSGTVTPSIDVTRTTDIVKPVVLIDKNTGRPLTIVEDKNEPIKQTEGKSSTRTEPYSEDYAGSLPGAELHSNS